MTVTATPLPLKRVRHRRGSERVRDSDANFAIALASDEYLHELAAALPQWAPGDPGRPPLMPPALHLLYGVMRWGWGSDRKVAREFQYEPTWQAVRRIMFQRYPQYQGVAPNATSITRSQYWYYRQTHGIDTAVFDALVEEFRDTAAATAQAWGMFDPTKVSWTRPPETNSVSGDCTTFNLRSDAAPGTKQFDPETGEIVDKRYDPDATEYTIYDEFGNPMTTNVFGLKFAILHARLPYEAEQIITDIVPVRGGKRNDEATLVVDAVERFQRRAPGLQSLVYDMAIRGTNREALYRLGLHTITKVPSTRKGKPRSRNLGMLTARKRGTPTVQVEAWAIDGAVHIKTVAQGKVHLVRLERTKTQRRKNRGRRSSRFAWYNHLRIPADPLVPPRLHGAAVVIRLDDPRAGPGSISRADSLHALAPGDPDWERLFDLRNPTESVNAWIKAKLHGKRSRAPAVGAARNHFALLCAAIYNNFQAIRAHARRLRGP